MSNKDSIIIKGARVNNLKNVDVELPRNKFIVITGLSGSGKSSLAFDTLYAEGQRRYVESLSAYARQFLGRMSKPEVDFIKGLPPAIAIEQKVNTRNPRSTVGTSTEIYDYLRLLYGRIGHTFSPVSGKEVKKNSADDVTDAVLTYPAGTRIAIAAPINKPADRKAETQLDIYLKEGYSRLISTDGNFESIENLIKSNIDDAKLKEYRLLIDRMVVSNEKDEISRLTESIETAFFEGNDNVEVFVWKDRDSIERLDFSRKFEADGISFIEPSDLLFNFNNPYGACPVCEGFGKTRGIAENLVIPDTSLSVYDNAVACWRGPVMGQWKEKLISLSSSIGFPIHRPYFKLSQEERDILWHGKGGFEGIDGFFKMVDSNLAKVQYRIMKANYSGKTICHKCHGSRLRPEALYVKINGKTIADLVVMSVDELDKWFDTVKLTPIETKIAARLLTEIRSRLRFLNDVGLGYLTLDRLSSSLSGGESQRINLATSLGSSLVGSIYILDEPSIGLHPRDTHRLIGVLRNLQQIGNTVVVVEHDEEIMRASDYIIDVGRDAGRNGGNIVYQGPSDKIAEATDSYTADYLSGRKSIPTPSIHRKWSDYILVEGARENNLKNIDVKFPLGVLTVVTGVSGSGKSTLVRDILYRALNREFGNAGDAPGAFKGLSGDIKRLSGVEFVDQNPIGKSSRSNPATYLKAYDEIRALFASQQSAVQMGFTPSYFSFNTEGGRCEECKGEGYITVEMQFMADITIPCESCHGQRFKRDVLDITYRGMNINDVLNMTVDQAIEFFSEVNGSTERKIVKRLKPLQDVGLGYIKLGQSSSTLSGGENQRVKLASYLVGDSRQPTMFIFDEPTTGLHIHDISTLLDSLKRLIELGHTVVIIEHNIDVIKTADHVIDIGPEGGDKGGYIVATGTPDEIMKVPESYTGQFLKLEASR